MTRRAFEVTAGIALAVNGHVPDFVWDSITDTQYEAALAKWTNNGAG